MSVREYIGARYVPIIADPPAWDITKTYEPLTIVLNQGDSYTSRKYVPAGIALTNDEYWALTGNFNQSLAAVVTRVDALTQELDDIPNGIVKQTDDGLTNASASDITSLMGNVPVARATGDASGNNIANTYFKKNGGTITGETDIVGKVMEFNSTNISDGTIPQADGGGNAHINFKDDSDNLIGWVSPRLDSYGRNMLQIGARKLIDGEGSTNFFAIGVNDDGTNYIYVKDGDAWRKAIFGTYNGVLPISQGGTGATTAAGVRNALGLGNTTGALPIANGGTGATSLDGLADSIGIGSPESVSQSQFFSSVNATITNFSCFKWGKIVCGSFKCNNGSNFYDSYIIGTINSGYRPKSWYYNVIAGKNNTAGVFEFWASNTSGQTTIHSSVIGTEQTDYTLNVSFMYLVN